MVNLCTIVVTSERGAIKGKNMAIPKLSSGGRGLTLIEALISTLLVSVLLVGILGAFIISRLGVDRAKHRMMAMNKIRAHMEQEIKAGYLGGFGARADGTVDTDYYLTVDSGASVSFIIDDMNTASTADDLIGTIRPDPWSDGADRYYFKDGDGVIYTGEPPAGSGHKYGEFKKIGFVVEWTEKQFGGTMPTSRERAAAYVAKHS